jgi:hypothetical protein
MRCFDASTRLQKLLAAVLFCFVFPVAGQAQQMPPAQHPVPASPGQAPNSSDENDPMARRIMGQQAERRNTQRQQDIVNDTAKLLLLAQQLKAEVDKSSKDQLSISVVKKAEEIEKLAKSVKEKMKAN